MTSKERSPRSRTFLAGVIVHSGGRSLNCAVRNLSADGALVRLEALAHPGPPMILLIPKNGVARYATIAWQKAADLGLQLGEAIDLKNPGGPLELVARSLWVERGLR